MAASEANHDHQIVIYDVQALFSNNLCFSDKSKSVFQSIYLSHMSGRLLWSLVVVL